ncbi:LLM class flavin-dependent oxidoreductase [Nocardioides zeae]|uniref:Alkanesulfonate monooxygenase SsuD/methylene tetrahydromethanopterin reductase-like flavin-dependent oxidoreductase (Luciferase family) n=1 Tax=Nocardioides zeae TaxID=1457234 RepID=A0AAJ1WYQ7_9ACTN|nr:LLM class flavin-dependent oxidoreductase [Nocardioides zeae]MDQ1102893.1 alkanesulfonate monooxygenase SsuD/methylene tetrahydromethanopterin reductase-like flavin-dependent oxidoreductase (luciferase family) [Nocardioides zeae]
MTVHLTVLDLLPRSSGDDDATVLANARSLAVAVEAAGYRRLWFAEHHLNPGVLGSSPAVTIALVGPVTSHIRLGSAGVQIGHRTPLATVEEFGLLAAAFGGRLDLGIGRSPSRPAPGTEQPGGPSHALGRAPARHTTETRTANGLLLPAPYTPGPGTLARLRATLDLLQQPGAWAPPYDEQLDEVVALLEGSVTDAEGRRLTAAPGEGADVDLWVLGASAGTSASVAGARGLPFVASYHHSPATVVDAVEAYRAAFRPSEKRAAPYVAVSVDAVAAPTSAEAQRLAAGYGPWVRSIRAGEGAIPYPSDAEVPALRLGDEDAALVDDRVRTQLVGDPGEVADRLEQVVGATGADEIAITTMTHAHADRVRSYELIAAEWARRGHVAPTS